MKLKLLAKKKTDPREYDNCYLFKVIPSEHGERLIFIKNFINYEDADKYVKELDEVFFVKDYEISKTTYDGIFAED